MESDYEDSYYIMNTALYAAERYILENYNVATRTSLIHEYLGTVSSDTIYPKYIMNNILALYTSDGYTLPSVFYYDEAESVYTQSEGPLLINEDALDISSATDLSVEYVAGYLYPAIPSDTPVISDGNYDTDATVTRPAISNFDGAPLHSPLSTMKTYYDLGIIGDPGSSLYVNGLPAELLDAQGAEVTEAVPYSTTINEERRGLVSLTLVNGINTFEISAIDDANNSSDAITIIINKQDTFTETYVELMSKDLATNDGNYTIVINSDIGATISINGTDEVLYSNGVSVIETTVAVEGVNDIVIIVTNPSGSISKTLTTRILYDTTLTDNQISALNNISPTITQMPEDILMALLMIAHHYYRIALYKHEETLSYGDNVSNRTTFNENRFPKEAHRILSKYIKY